MHSPWSALAAAALISTWSMPASAVTLQLVVRSASGAPARDAVVTVYPAGGGYAPNPSATPLVMAQKDIAFSPYVLIAPVGAVVAFPNHDVVRHHVYSFSKPHPFQLKLYGREAERTERFDRAGVVALGCNIHDAMAAYIKVVDTRFTALTDAEGRARVTGLPDGPAVVKVWHPQAASPNGEDSRTTTLTDGAVQTWTLALRPPPPGKQHP